jgi:F0F1-type ATP synthase assembly protein I
MDRSNEPAGRQGDAPPPRSSRTAKPYLDAAWIMTGSVAFGVLAGMGLDHMFGTRPWLLVTGSSLGLVGGFTGFVLIVSRMGK